MKHLLLSLLLFSGLCQAQQQFKNTTKVLACRLVNSDDNGPCSIEYYAKKLRRTGHYIQAMESYNDTLAYSLLQLKADAKTWNKEAWICGEAPDTLGKPLVTNMFIVEVNSQKDTIFTTADNRAVFFPKEQLRYTAPDNRITAVFNREVKEFFNRDFATEIYKWQIDSISTKTITLQKKPFYGLTRKEFEKDVYNFDVARTDSVYLSKKQLYKALKSYYINDIKFSFDGIDDQISEVALEYTSLSKNQSGMTTISVDGIKIGDSEDVLCNKYDNSTLLKNWDAPLVALNNYYTYEVALDNLEGLVRYTIRNKVIQSIHISFSYPKGPRKKKKKQ